MTTAGSGGLVRLLLLGAGYRCLCVLPVKNFQRTVKKRITTARPRLRLAAWAMAQEFPIGGSGRQKIVYLILVEARVVGVQLM